ncbi:TetR/AcrR family transcriptional regulator [Dietzia timorensis]|uniref:HTH-type transcriptional regulator BetI n=1 Tax=Dietzia timorensis TaxID=499555 RepID=A0A173LR22_9ACTN|nr:TetR/AcrR family transcriptional regulator [Dietzia timorensis]ANI93240.1 HTH-type transcriptional regulator BetI [Dietzia timorensis]
MPRISDARRAAQREKIVHALLATVTEKGVADTSMADVIERSGLSAGAIYGYFASKDEILIAAARVVVQDRAANFAELAERDPVPPPSRAVSEVAGSLPDVTRNARAMMQIWGQAMTHDVLSTWTGQIVDNLLEAIQVYLRAWFAQAGRVDPDDAAQRSAPAFLAFVQGYIVQTALRGEVDMEAYVEGIDTLVGGWG